MRAGVSGLPLRDIDYNLLYPDRYTPGAVREVGAVFHHFLRRQSACRDRGRAVSVQIVNKHKMLCEL